MNLLKIKVFGERLGKKEIETLVKMATAKEKIIQIFQDKIDEMIEKSDEKHAELFKQILNQPVSPEHTIE